MFDLFLFKNLCIINKKKKIKIKIKQPIFKKSSLRVLSKYEISLWSRTKFYRSIKSHRNRGQVDQSVDLCLYSGIVGWWGWTSNVHQSLELSWLLYQNFEILFKNKKVMPYRFLKISKSLRFPVFCIVCKGFL